MEGWGGGSDFHVNRSLLAGVYTSLSPPDALSSALCLSCVHLPLPAVASPNTQSHCCCLATLPFTSQPLFTSALLPPSLSLFLSGLMNGVAGLWAAHPQWGVASHCWLSHIRVRFGVFVLFSFTYPACAPLSNPSAFIPEMYNKNTTVSTVGTINANSTNLCEYGMAMQLYATFPSDHFLSSVKTQTQMTVTSCTTC